MPVLSGMRCSGRVEIQGINPYVLISKDIVEQLAPKRKRPIPILLTILGMKSGPWKINLMPRGDGAFYLYLSEHIRKDVDAQVGHLIRFTLAIDSTYENGPQHVMPGYLHTALDANAIANAHWHALPPSRKKEILRYLSGLKSHSTCEKNLARLMHVLAGNPGRYMARDWNNGK